jgi:hypothetical protein
MHKHKFAESEWPFVDPPNVTAISTVHILEGRLPILRVTHDIDDGIWQILCGTTNDPAEGRVLCLGCLFERDRSIGELADLPLGWIAWRVSRNDPWQRATRESHTGAA